MERMTHLIAGTGYADRLPCTGPDHSRWLVRLTPDEDDARDRVCTFRDRMSRSGHPEPSALEQA
jgi:hypothetical protein